MWIGFVARRTHVPAEGPPQPGATTQPRRTRRRAATSMEYVVVASFILLVVIAGLQSFGVSVSKLFTADAAATSKAQPTQQ